MIVMIVTEELNGYAINLTSVGMLLFCRQKQRGRGETNQQRISKHQVKI